MTTGLSRVRAVSSQKLPWPVAPRFWNRTMRMVMPMATPWLMSTWITAFRAMVMPSPRTGTWIRGKIIAWPPRGAG